jgi:hypothetical protein
MIHTDTRSLAHDFPVRTPDPKQRWLTFIRNHSKVIRACGFFVVITAAFRTLYVFIVIAIGSRQILHHNATVRATAQWTLRQFREALPGHASILQFFGWRLQRMAGAPASFAFWRALARGESVQAAVQIGRRRFVVEQVLLVFASVYSFVMPDYGLIPIGTFWFWHIRFMTRALRRIDRTPLPILGQGAVLGLYTLPGLVSVFKFAPVVSLCSSLAAAVLAPVIHRVFDNMQFKRYLRTVA